MLTECCIGNVGSGLRTDREDEDCMFDFFFFLLRGDILFHMKEEQDK